MTRRDLALFQVLVSLVVLGVSISADAATRIRIRANETADVITIDETSSPPMITVTPGVSVQSKPGGLLDLGGGQYQILVPGDAKYHLKTHGGIDAVTVIDGPGESNYWIGVGADNDTVTIHDGPGEDVYKVEGKGEDEIYEVRDDTGTGDDLYYLKGASGSELFNITDGPGNDIYKLNGARDHDEFVFTDAGGDVDFVVTKNIEVVP